MQTYTTQMDAARKGIVTPQMETVAKKEYRTVEEIRQLVAEGKVAIPANKHHECLNPEGIGSMLRTKINVNLGVSRDCKDYDVEMQKVMEAVNMGAHAIMETATIILVFTALSVGLWIYRSIAVPLVKLKKATKNIKEGNLDFVLEVEGNDEFSQLCQDFEEMRKRLKESTEEKILMDKENKELISNISHDLKTPITAVKGYVEGIMDGVADTPEKMIRYVRTIYIKTNEMDHLINELTFYS